MSYDSLIKILLGFLSGFIWLSIIIFPFLNSTDSSSNIIQAIGALSTGFSAFIALIAFVWNQLRNRTKVLSEDAIINLERAFEVLTQGDPQNGPKKDRLVWLTTARHLSTYENIKKEIENSPDTVQYKILLSHEEYWRCKFYELLKGEKGIGLSEYYYHDATVDIDENQIAPSSLAVIYKFIEWPMDKEDPLSDVDHLKIFKESDIFFFNPGVKNYLTKRFTKYKEAFLEENDT